MDCVDECGNTPLHRYAAGETDVDAALFENADWVRGRNRDGDTPLHVAAKSGDVDRCRRLLTHGADPLQRNNRNRTPRSQPKVSTDIKALLLDWEETFKERKRERDGELWDAKMQSTQTESAFGVGVV